MKKSDFLDDKTTAIIIQDFEIELQDEDPMTEEQLFQLLANRIAEMIDRRLDFLLSLMYRLDIAESKINFALSPVAPDPANIGFAKLILERQKERIFTKKKYEQAPLPDDLKDLEF